MRLPRIPTLLRTLWYLRTEQVRGQLGQVFWRGSGPVRLEGPPPGLRLAAPAAPWLPAPPHAAWDGGDRLRLLSREASFAGGIDWAFTREGPLFAFHLHQFDWARDPEASAQARYEVLASWAAYHCGELGGRTRQDVGSVGWHPATASLRTFAWIKLLTTPGALPGAADTRAIRSALAEGVATVAARPETHLLANHYLWNLLALVMAGVVLEGSQADTWLAQQDALVREIDEQVLPDGTHYERSPMYHSLLLENLLDLWNVARSIPGRLDEAVARRVEDAAARMLGALALLTHPDGEIALFGDSAFGIAHPPAVLAAYAEALGVAPRSADPPGLLRDAGFVRLEAGPFVLLATAAAPMPAHQPGHAHCDALSFELSVGRQRVVTDTGVCEYLRGPRRDISRATRSHATVEVDGREQAEIWAAHRVGGRPDVGILRAEPPNLLEAVCSGWATPEVLHRRRFEVTPDGVHIQDDFDAPAPRARMHLPLAPGLEPVLEGRHVRVGLEDGRRLEIELPADARWEIARRPCYPAFGREELRAVLVGEAGPLSSARWLLRVV